MLLELVRPELLVGAVECLVAAVVAGPELIELVCDAGDLCGVKRDVLAAAGVVAAEVRWPKTCRAQVQQRVREERASE